VFSDRGAVTPTLCWKQLFVTLLRSDGPMSAALRYCWPSCHSVTLYVIVAAAEQQQQQQQHDVTLYTRPLTMLALSLSTSYAFLKYKCFFQFSYGKVVCPFVHTRGGHIVMLNCVYLKTTLAACVLSRNLYCPLCEKTLVLRFLFFFQKSEGSHYNGVRKISDFQVVTSKSPYLRNGAR